MNEFGQALGGAAAEFSMPGLHSYLTPIVDMTNTFVGQIKRLVAPFEQLTNIATHFVAVLDPSLVEDLTRKFRDLNAVIGVAMRPVVETAREIVKYLSDRLLPVMRELQPIISDLSDAVGDALKQGIDDMINFLRSAMPTLKALKDFVVGLIHVLQDVWQLFMTLGKTITEIITGALGGFGTGTKTVTDLMKEFRDAVREVIKNLILFAARLMLSFGFTRGVDALMKGLERQRAPAEQSGGMAVAINSAFKSAGELSKNALLEAFRASTMTQKAKNPAEETNEWLGKIKEELAALKTAGASEDHPLVKKINSMLTFLNEKILPNVDLVGKWFGGIDSSKITEFVNANVAAMGKIDVSKVTNFIDKVQKLGDINITDVNKFITEAIADYRNTKNDIQSGWKTTKKVGKAAVNPLGAAIDIIRGE